VQQSAAKKNEAMDDWNDAEARVKNAAEQKTADPSATFPDGLPDAPETADKEEKYKENAMDSWQAAEAKVKAAQPGAAYPEGLPDPKASPSPAASPAAASVAAEAKQEDKLNCKAVIATATDEWCTSTCATDYCPPTACKCDDKPKRTATGHSSVQLLAPQDSPAPAAALDAVPTDWATGAPLPQPAAYQPDTRDYAGNGNTSCVSILAGTSDYWCATSCAAGDCPQTMCKCGEGAKKSKEDAAAKALDSWKEAEARVKAVEPDTAYPGGLPTAAPSPAPAASPGASATPGKCTAIVATATNDWCTATCATSYCPPTSCKCDD
jgi:hypothetical protein